PRVWRSFTSVVTVVRESPVCRAISLRLAVPRCRRASITRSRFSSRRASSDPAVAIGAGVSSVPALLSRACDKSAGSCSHMRRSACVLLRGGLKIGLPGTAPGYNRSVKSIPQGGSTVRTLLFVLAGLTLITASSTSATLAASTRSQASLSLHVSSYRVLYGHGLTVAGRLTGAHAAGSAVSVYARPYGSSAPVRLAVVRTASNGRWTYQAAPHIRTTYWATSGQTASRRVVVGVSPALSIDVLPSGHVRTHVIAARS